MNKAELLRISVSWGNRDFAAPYDFLRELDWYMGHTTGHVVECGSGATTLVINAHIRCPDKIRDLSKYREAHILESDPEWHRLISEKIDPQSTVIPHLVPLIDQPDGSKWYDVSNTYIPKTTELNLLNLLRLLRLRKNYTVIK